jgi:hypothetical protein
MHCSVPIPSIEDEWLHLFCNLRKLSYVVYSEKKKTRAVNKGLCKGGRAKKRKQQLGWTQEVLLVRQGVEERGAGGARLEGRLV